MDLRSYEGVSLGFGRGTTKHGAGKAFACASSNMGYLAVQPIMNLSDVKCQSETLDV